MRTLLLLLSLLTACGSSSPKLGPCPEPSASPSVPGFGEDEPTPSPSPSATLSPEPTPDDDSSSNECSKSDDDSSSVDDCRTFGDCFEPSDHDKDDWTMIRIASTGAQIMPAVNRELLKRKPIPPVAIQTTPGYEVRQKVRHRLYYLYGMIRGHMDVYMDELAADARADAKENAE